MYCHNCGKEVFGNFCSSCGSKVIGDQSSASDIDWTSERNFEKLIKYPEVRKVISKFADGSAKKTSSQQFLEWADWVMVPLAGVSVKKISTVAVPIYEKLGIRTGKSAKKTFDQPIQPMIVKTLCSLAKSGYPLKSFEAASDGIALTAEIPSDLLQWGGNIIISIEEIGTTSELTIATKIKGQFFDWGTSKKLIKNIFIDMDQIELGI